MSWWSNNVFLLIKEYRKVFWTTITTLNKVFWTSRQLFLSWWSNNVFLLIKENRKVASWWSKIVFFIILAQLTRRNEAIILTAAGPCLNFVIGNFFLLDIAEARLRISLKPVGVIPARVMSMGVSGGNLMIPRGSSLLHDSLNKSNLEQNFLYGFQKNF